MIQRRELGATTATKRGEPRKTRKENTKRISHRLTQINTDDFRASSFVSFASLVVPSSLVNGETISIRAYPHDPRFFIRVIRFSGCGSARQDFLRFEYSQSLAAHFSAPHFSVFCSFGLIRPKMARNLFAKTLASSENRRSVGAVEVLTRIERR